MYPECRHVRPSGAGCRAAALGDSNWCYFHARMHARQARQAERDARVAASRVCPTAASPRFRLHRFPSWTAGRAAHPAPKCSSTTRRPNRNEVMQSDLPLGRRKQQPSKLSTTARIPSPPRPAKMHRSTSRPSGTQPPSSLRLSSRNAPAFFSIPCRSPRPTRRTSTSRRDRQFAPSPTATKASPSARRSSLGC